LKQERGCASLKEIFMKKILITLLLVTGFLWPARLLSQEPMLTEHREWLENVSPIMTRVEREVFLKLRTSADRKNFIHFFWKQRDPLPDTEENEFEKEYMGRVRFADAHFGHGTPKRGSQTERGFFYLVLGAPLERTEYTTLSELLPLELWFYRGEERYGLPPYFYLIFYQPLGMGEFRLYSPGVEGPEKLVLASMSDQALNRSSAYKIIKQVSAELARASLSYIPGEQPYGQSSFSSDSIVASVRSLPENKYSDYYARDYLRYKDYIQTEHTDLFVACNALVRVFRQGGGQYLHWSLEPGRMNFAERNGGYYASFELILRMEDAEGRAVLETQEEVPLRITADKYKQNERRRFAFQDVLPVVPGQYKLFVLLKNKTGKDFTSFETNVSVPPEEGPPGLSNLLLYRSREDLSAPDMVKLKAFFLDGAQYFFNAQNEFSPRASLGVYAQLFHGLPSAAGPAEVRLEIISHDTGQAVFSRTTPLAEVVRPGREGLDIGPVELSAIKPGYYQLKLSVGGQPASTLLLGQENMIILAQNIPDLPWVYSRQHPLPPNAENSYLLGSEYFLSGRFDQARRLLEESLRFKDSPATRLLLAKTLYSLGRFRESLALAAPLYEATRDREAAKVAALGQAGLKDWTAALVYLDALLSQATEINVLNLAAECRLNLNQPEEALRLAEKSLQLDPGQPRLREMAEKAKAMLKKEES
jgi:GWxTD domain-containing protein